MLGRALLIRPHFSDQSKEVAMAINFGAKSAKLAYSPSLELLHSDYNIAMPYKIW